MSHRQDLLVSQVCARARAAPRVQCGRERPKRSMADKASPKTARIQTEPPPKSARVPNGSVWPGDQGRGPIIATEGKKQKRLGQTSKQ
ncbi:hypothetical protein PAPYR_13279 [Paratrimastix pyriformis]|uniref:Uncharacterized protein n=1 Tax=Paratrimastix pyriformis TaxID=342808 RepID=A0ABQ8U0J7_9EUKA|nr:hypothetical protein PAPYR_13279 [Paratrimastix pyriformis]